MLSRVGDHLADGNPERTPLTMSKDSSETRVAGTGTVYVSTYGAAALPSSYNSPLPSAYFDLGYTDEDGVTFRDEPTIEKKGAWQSFYPVRIIETARMAEAEFALEQWNTNTLKLAAGGGTVTSAGSGSKFTPHAAGTVTEFTVVIDRVDGSITDRFVIPRCMVTSALETNSTKDDLSLLPVTVEAIGIDGADPWFLFSSDTGSFA